MTIDNLEISTIISQCSILFLLAGLGFLCAKSRYMPESTGVILSTLVIRIAMPALILSKMLSADFSREEFRDGFILVAVAIVTLLIIYAISIGIGKALYLLPAARAVYSMQSMFGNISFFALPLLLALFGNDGVIYGLFFNMGNDILLWSLGVHLASKHKNEGRKGSLKHFINANTIAFALGLILMLTDFSELASASSVGAVRSIYNVFYTTVDMIGSTTSSLSMIFIGFILASTTGVKVKNRTKTIATGVLTLQKMLLMPIVFGLILLMLYKFGLISSSVVMIAVLQLAMPVGTITVSLATEHNSDYFFAAKNVFATTVISLLSLPLIAMLIKIVL